MEKMIPDSKETEEECWRAARPCGDTPENGPAIDFNCRAWFRCGFEGDYVIKWLCVDSDGVESIGGNSSQFRLCPFSLTRDDGLVDCPPPVVCPDAGGQQAPVISADSGYLSTDIILVIAVTSFALLAMLLTVGSTYKYWSLRKRLRYPFKPGYYTLRDFPFPVRYHNLWGTTFSPGDFTPDSVKHSTNSALSAYNLIGYPDRTRSRSHDESDARSRCQRDGALGHQCMDFYFSKHSSETAVPGPATSPSGAIRQQSERLYKPTQNLSGDVEGSRSSIQLNGVRSITADDFGKNKKRRDTCASEMTGSFIYHDPKGGSSPVWRVASPVEAAGENILGDRSSTHIPELCAATSTQVGSQSRLGRELRNVGFNAKSKHSAAAFNGDYYTSCKLEPLPGVTDAYNRLENSNYYKKETIRSDCSLEVLPVYQGNLSSAASTVAVHGRRLLQDINKSNTKGSKNNTTSMKDKRDYRPNRARVGYQLFEDSRSSNSFVSNSTHSCAKVSSITIPSYSAIMKRIVEERPQRELSFVNDCILPPTPVSKDIKAKPEKHLCGEETYRAIQNQREFDTNSREIGVNHHKSREICEPCLSKEKTKRSVGVVKNTNNFRYHTEVDGHDMIHQRQSINTGNLRSFPEMENPTENQNPWHRQTHPSSGVCFKRKSDIREERNITNKNRKKNKRLKGSRRKDMGPSRYVKVGKTTYKIVPTSASCSNSTSSYNSSSRSNSCNGSVGGNDATFPDSSRINQVSNIDLSYDNFRDGHLRQVARKGAGVASSSTLDAGFTMLISPDYRNGHNSSTTGEESSRF